MVDVVNKNSPPNPPQPMWQFVRDEVAYWGSLARQDVYDRLLRSSPPLLIGGTGGSGTRVFVSICERAGYFPGSNLNRSNDALNTVPWVQKWLPQAITQLQAEGRSVAVRMRRELNLAMMRHRRGIPSTTHPWVMKNPRLMLALPYLHKCLPSVKFIHVVRDGRDVAFSKNQNQLRDYGALWLGADLADAELPVRSIAYWAKNESSCLGIRQDDERKLSARSLRGSLHGPTKRHGRDTRIS